MRYKISNHALQRYIERSNSLGFTADIHTLLHLIENAKPEKVDRRNWPQYKRVIKGDTLLLENNGWRFVVDKKKRKIVTIERTDPAENWVAKYISMTEEEDV